MRRIAVTLVGVALLLGATATAAIATGSQSAPARILDQSFVCTTGLVGGIREIEVRANRGVREPGTRRWKQLPFTVVATGPTARWGDLGNSVAFVTAGGPSPTTTVGSEQHLAEVADWGTIARSTTECRPTRAQVPLSPRGLQGGQAGPFGDDFDCQVPRRVLVRIRALMRSPARLTARQGLARTSVPAAEARLAVRTEKGKPLVYAEAFQSGAARIFTARSCFPE